MGPQGYISESEDEGQYDGNQTKRSSNETNIENNDATPPTKRVGYDGADGQGYFMLGMTFTNVVEAREAINKYVVMFGYKLKLNPNEPHRIVAKCKN